MTKVKHLLLLTTVCSILLQQGYSSEESSNPTIRKTVATLPKKPISSEKNTRNPVESSQLSDQNHLSNKQKTGNASKTTDGSKFHLQPMTEVASWSDNTVNADMQAMKEQQDELEKLQFASKVLNEQNNLLALKLKNKVLLDQLLSEATKSTPINKPNAQEDKSATVSSTTTNTFTLNGVLWINNQDKANISLGGKTHLYGVGDRIGAYVIMNILRSSITLYNDETGETTTVKVAGSY